MPGDFRVAEQIVVVTDIDASLLEAGTRSLSDERAALDFLAERGIPLIINSSRSRATCPTTSSC